VRILAKRLRYALDVLSVALPREATERYVAALAELQDVLGELNDVAVAKSVCAQIIDEQHFRELVRGWLFESARDREAPAESRLLALSQMATPWLP
jgi:CHAD domain-containing protein